MARWVTVLVGIAGTAAALAMATTDIRTIYSLVLEFMGLLGGTLSGLFVLGIFSRRMNREGAIAGMLVGLISTLVYIFWFKGWFFIPGTRMAANAPENWFMGISPEAFGAVGALLNFGIAGVVARMTPAPPAQIQHLVEDIRVPRGAAVASPLTARH